MRRPTPSLKEYALSYPQGGRPPKHGGEFVFGDPATWGTEQAVTVTDTRRYGKATAQAWDRLHPRLTRRAAWLDHEGPLPIIEGTVIRLAVEKLPSGGVNKPLWLWWSGTAATTTDLDRCWQSFLRRFDIERSKPDCCRSHALASLSLFSFIVLDYRGLLVVEPGLSGLVAAGLLMERAEPVDFGCVGLDGPRMMCVVALVAGDPALGELPVEGDARDAERAGEVGQPPLAGAKCGAVAAEGLFAAADAAQILQEMTDPLGSEAFTALGWAESFAVQDVRDGGRIVAALAEFTGAGCQARVVAELVQACDGPDELAVRAVSSGAADAAGSRRGEAPAAVPSRSVHASSRPSWTAAGAAWSPTLPVRTGGRGGVGVARPPADSWRRARSRR